MGRWGDWCGADPSRARSHAPAWERLEGRSRRPRTKGQEHILFLDRTVPLGTTDNSAAIYCRGWAAGVSQVPLGTTELIGMAMGLPAGSARNRECSLKFDDQSFSADRTEATVIPGAAETRNPGDPRRAWIRSFGGNDEKSLIIE